MRTLIGPVRARVLAVIGRVPMYRLVLLALSVLAIIAFGVSFTGQSTAQPLALVVSALVLLISVGVVDVIGHLIIRRPVRVESGAITALILLFVLRPSTEPADLAVLALAGAAASASKYVLAWRGRHILNPAAFGAAVVTVTTLGSSMWWVGTPLLVGAVVALGILVAWRAEKLRVAGVFLLVALVLAFVRNLVLAAEFGLTTTPWQALTMVMFSSPIVFAAFFMITEPLTLPARRWQQLVVAAVAGLLVGWPLTIGSFYVYPEVAILVANVVAFALAYRTRRGLRLRIADRRMVTPSVEEITFTSDRPFAHAPGQFVELEVRHRGADVRGSRREFSLVAVPGADAQSVRVAYRVPTGHVSSFKRALRELPIGSVVHSTGVHGDFTPPSDSERPVLLVAAGIGITPFTAHLAADPARDTVLLYVTSSVADLAYRDELAASGARVIVVAPDAGSGAGLPAGWTGYSGRLTAEVLREIVPDLTSRDALVSGPPRLIADLTPALREARSLRTDAFAGY